MTLLTACAAASALLVIVVPAASAAPAATSVATKTCWLDVVNDWLDNNRVDKTYATPCYTQAIQQLNRYPDVQNYSSAADDIHRALLAAIHEGSSGSNGNGGGGTGGGGTGNGSDTGSGSGTGSSGTPSASGKPDPITHVFNSGRPANAQSVPLPLLVLGGLAALLLLSAVGTWFMRRHGRRGRPSPSPAPAVDKRG